MKRRRISEDIEFINEFDADLLSFLGVNLLMSEKEALDVIKSVPRTGVHAFIEGLKIIFDEYKKSSAASSYNSMVPNGRWYYAFFSELYIHLSSVASGGLQTFISNNSGFTEEVANRFYNKYKTIIDGVVRREGSKYYSIKSLDSLDTFMGEYTVLQKITLFMYAFMKYSAEKFDDLQKYLEFNQEEDDTYLENIKERKMKIKEEVRSSEKDIEPKHKVDYINVVSEAQKRACEKVFEWACEFNKDITCKNLFSDICFYIDNKNIARVCEYGSIKVEGCICRNKNIFFEHIEEKYNLKR